MVDCMSCLVKLAQGCPSDGHVMLEQHGVCARVRAASSRRVSSIVDAPAHMFTWSKTAARWTFYDVDGGIMHWALLKQ